MVSKRKGITKRMDRSFPNRSFPLGFISVSPFRYILVIPVHCSTILFHRFRFIPVHHCGKGINVPNLRIALISWEIARILTFRNQLNHLPLFFLHFPVVNVKFIGNSSGPSNQTNLYPCISPADIWKFQGRDPFWRRHFLASGHNWFYPGTRPALEQERTGQDSLFGSGNRDCGEDMCGYPAFQS